MGALSLEAGHGLMVQGVGQPIEELGLARAGERRTFRGSEWLGVWSRSDLGRPLWDCGRMPDSKCGGR